MAEPLHRVVVSQRFFDDATMDYFRANGCDPILVDMPPGQADTIYSPAELLEMLHGAKGWMVGHAKVTRELLTALPALRVVARRGVGYDAIDVAAARELGRVVTIAAGGNHDSVADLAIGLMLSAARHMRESQKRMIGGDWAILMGAEVYRSTVGLIGLGRIGRAVVQRLKGFEARVLACVPHPDMAFGAANGVSYVDLPTLLAESDYISVHAPLTPETRFLIDGAALARMKPSSVLINTARGGLVEDRQLLEALQAGRIAGAGLDVFASDSDPSYAEVSKQLIRLPNVAATPHAGASTLESLARTNMIAAEAIVAVLRGRSPPLHCVVADGRPGR